MSTWTITVGSVKFTRVTFPLKEPRIEVATKGVTVSILQDKKVFDAATFAAFCTEENAKRMVKEYVDPLLKWVTTRGA